MRETEITVQVFDKFEEIEKVLTQKGYKSFRQFYTVLDHINLS